MAASFDQPVARFKWLRRWACAVMFLVMAIIGFRLVIGWKQGREIAGLEKQVREAGGYWTDLDLRSHPPIPDDQNAATLYLKAIALFVEGQECFRNSNYDYDWNAEKPPLWYYLAGASDARYDAMFKLAVDATKHSNARWEAPAKTPALSPHLVKSRTMANELADNVQYRHAMGDDAVAIERVRALLHFGRCLRQEPRMVDQMVAIGIVSLGCNALLEIAPSLQANEPSLEQAIRTLMHELEVDDADLSARAREAIWSEISATRTVVNISADQTWLTRPALDQLFCANVPLLLREHADWQVAVRDPAPSSPQLNLFGGQTALDLPPALAIPTKDSQIALTPPSELPLTVMPLFSRGLMDRYREMVRRMQLELRFVRTSLAVRLFVLKNGAFPRTLDELVPGYLPAVPTNPGFDSNRLQIVVLKGAHRDKSDRRMLAADAKTSRNGLPAEYCSDWNRYAADGSKLDDLGRQWRDVAPWLSTAFLPPMEASHNQASRGSNGGTYNNEPGFEESGLETSVHSPGPTEPPQAFPGF